MDLDLTQELTQELTQAQNSFKELVSKISSNDLSDFFQWIQRYYLTSGLGKNIFEDKILNKCDLKNVWDKSRPSLTRHSIVFLMISNKWFR